jgi:hypothetical protein
MFTAVENIASAITIKSFLNKQALFNALENLASVPQLDPEILTFKFLQNNPFENFSKGHPTFFVFCLRRDFFITNY